VRGEVSTDMCRDFVRLAPAIGAEGGEAAGRGVLTKDWDRLPHRRSMGVAARVT
jgi:hypothetical protein